MIDIQIDDREVMATLKRVAAKVDNLRPVMGMIAADMLDAVRENFDQEGRPERWTPLAPSTLKRLEKKGSTGKMLNRSSAGLWHSIHPQSDADSARVGTNKKYAAIHHFGGPAGRGHKVNIPARPFMVLDEDDKRQIVVKLERYLAP